MAPRTHRLTRSKAIVIPDNTQLTIAEDQAQLGAGTQRDVDDIQLQHQTSSAATIATNACRKGKRRAIAPSNISAPTRRSAAKAALELPPTKRARNAGPPRGRPMPLELVSGEEAIGRQSSGIGMVNRSEFRRITSFQPRREHPHREHDDPIVPDSEDEHISNADSYVETEVDSSPEQDTLAQTRPSKLHQAVRTERPSWQGSASTSGMSHSPGPSGSLGLSGSTAPRASGPLGSANASDSSGSAGTSGASGLSGPFGSPVAVGASGPPGTAGAINLSGSSGPLALVNSNAAVVDIANVSTPPAPTLPSNDTDLIFIPGTNRLILSAQRPLIRVIIQDAIENLRVYLLFKNAFPRPVQSIKFIRDSIVAAAEKYQPGSSAIVARINANDHYLSLMTRLPRPRIPLIRSDVKERCSTLVTTAFLALRSSVEIVKSVQKQLMNYNYMFPKAPNANGLVLRAQPYRNERIISVIRDLYFSGGTTSFAARFSHCFPTHPGHDGEPRNEVPVAMVALVATALYASLYEWRGGEHQPAEFSANSYLDVYDGHVNTFNHIKERHLGAYHTMMADLYAQASVTPAGHGTALGVAGVPIAELDIEELEED
ncbi:hypothetical protein V8E52_010914 [Russula decolorans]